MTAAPRSNSTTCEGVRPRLRALLPFRDDSTLFFADRMRAVLAGSPIDVDIAWLAQSSDISARQLSQVLPQGPDLLIRNDAFKKIEALASYDMILTSQLFPQLRDMLRNPILRHLKGRPAVLAFQGGLDFNAERGFFNRRFADAVFVVPKAHVARYQAWAAEDADSGSQYVGFGHPTFVRPQDAAAQGPRDIYFFAQAISPRSYRARLFMLRILVAIARANPDRTVWLKLRHLPTENTAHLHQERFAYTKLLSTLGADAIPNLKVTADQIEEVLPKVGIGLTCTSTAAVDLIRAGVPAMVYLDYIENYLDPLVAPMRALFQDSGLIVTLDEVLNLAPRRANPDWCDTMFCDRQALLAQIFEAHAHFQARPDLVRKVLPMPATPAEPGPARPTAEPPQPPGKPGNGADPPRGATAAPRPPADRPPADRP